MNTCPAIFVMVFSENVSFHAKHEIISLGKTHAKEKESKLQLPVSSL